MLDQPRLLRALVSELLSRYEDSRMAFGSQVEQEVVDQINIVSDWLRRRSGEGKHLILEPPPHGSAFQREVERWLKEAAAQVAAPSPSHPLTPSLPHSLTPSSATRSA